MEGKDIEIELGIIIALAIGFFIMLLVIELIYVGFGVSSKQLNNQFTSSQAAPSGDVLLLHNSAYTVYNGTGTDVSNGIALLNAVSNAVPGDSIFLRAETYNTLANSVVVPQNGGLFGAGKFKSIIVSTANQITPIVAPTNFSTTADLEIMGANVAALQTPWGEYASNSGSFHNATIRNVFIFAGSDGIMIYNTTDKGQTSAKIQNVSIKTYWDGISTITNTILTIEDTSINTTANSVINGGNIINGLYPQDIGNIIVVNSNIIAKGGLQKDDGIDAELFSNTVVILYGGNIITSSSGATNDILNNGGNKVYVNTTTSYNSMKTFGSIVNIGSAGFGAYSYSKSPIAPPQTTSGSGAALNFSFSGGNLANGYAVNLRIFILAIIILTILGLILIIRSQNHANNEGYLS